MGAPLQQQTTPVEPAAATVKTLVVTDLVDSTRLFATLGDQRAARLSARHERIARDLLARCGGREIDKTDGFLLLFERTVDALRFALAYHRALAALSQAEKTEIGARVGIHLGEVILRANSAEDVARGAKPVEIEGYAKPVAARVMALAKARQTLLTRGAFDLARIAATREEVSESDLRWLAHGPYVLKGVAEPVEIFEVGEKGFAPLLVPKSTEKARRAVSAEDELTLGWRPAPGLEVPRRPRWRLAEKLGEGGFGEVWRAVHEKTDENRVFKFCYRPDRLRSLQREVTLFRLLKETLGSREDIARILDWNFERAPYFLECEYTAGGNLLEWAQDQGGPAAVPLATKLELMAQVAEALAAAHSVGVLHKDVKPSNVLVTAGRSGRPQVRLTDFGIGVVTDREVLARQGITVFDLTEMVADSTGSAGGTHLYMAPELVEGRNPTVQADIYALGVMLYQFVVDDFSHAVAPGWRRDVPDEILQEDIAALVDGRPERRMRDAQRVAERLRSLEERRAAREAERRERAERAQERAALERAQRRRRLSAAIAGVSLAVLLIVSFLALQALDARREADRRRGQAESLIGFMVGDLREKLEPIGRLDVLDDVGEAALDYFESVPEGDLTDEELFQRSETLRQIGEVRVRRGDLPAAMEAFRESLALARPLAAAEPTRGEWLQGLGASHFWIGYVHWRLNELDEAAAEFREYARISEELARRDPDDSRWQLERAYAHSNIGSVLEARGELAAAQEEFETSLAVRRRLVARDPDNPEWLEGLATAHNKLGAVLLARGQLRKALGTFREDLETTRSLVEATPGDRLIQERLATSHSFVSLALASLGEWSEAFEHLREAEDLLAQLVRTDPENSRWRRNLASVRLKIAELLVARGEMGSALELTRAARDDLRALVARHPTDRHWRVDLGNAYTGTGLVYLRLGRLEDARVELDRAKEILRPLVEENRSDRQSARSLSRALTLLGQVSDRTGNRAHAKERWREAVDIVEPLARNSNDTLLLAAWVEPLLRLGRTAEAAAPAERLERMGFRDPELTELLARASSPAPA